MKKTSIVAEKAYQFAIRIVRMCQYLETEKREYVMSKQVLRSGTSIGANCYGAISAESDADFIHKFQIALKEANETDYWLRLLKDTKYIDENVAESIRGNCLEIIKILRSIIISMKKKLDNK
jgi:four helix bundle protein